MNKRKYNEIKFVDFETPVEKIDDICLCLDNKNYIIITYKSNENIINKKIIEFVNFDIMINGNHCLISEYSGIIIYINDDNTFCNAGLGQWPLYNDDDDNVDDDNDGDDADLNKQPLEAVISNTISQSATIQDQVIVNKLSQQLSDLKIKNLNHQFLKKIKYEIEEHGDYFAYNMKFNKNNKKYAQSPLISFNKLAFLLHLFYTFVLN